MVAGLSITASDDHEFSYQVGTGLITQADAARLKVFERSMNNLDGALDDELAGVDLGLRLLRQQQALCHFG